MLFHEPPYTEPYVPVVWEDGGRSSKQERFSQSGYRIAGCGSAILIVENRATALTTHGLFPIFYKYFDKQSTCKKKA